MDRAPRSINALLLLVLIFFLNNDFSQSLSLLNGALDWHPRAKVLRQRVQDTEQAKIAGNKLFHQSRFKEALVKYEEALKASLIICCWPFACALIILSRLSESISRRLEEV